MSYSEVFIIPKSDSENSDITIRGFIAPESGVVRVLSSRDIVVNIPVVRGYIYPISIKRVMDTGTTVGQIVGLA